jgi:MOSC domain-containing protein YiiM
VEHEGLEGRLAGIARHDRPRGPIEVLEAIEVTLEGGLAGDWRGSLKPGANRRQVSLMEAASWAAAIGELGVDAPWWQRRANLLVEGLHLPRRPGFRIRIGAECLVEVTMECDPCNRMEEVAPGLREALTPDWRGGVLAFVAAPGTIRVGDRIGIER